jgi:hypothetical protein
MKNKPFIPNSTPDLLRAVALANRLYKSDPTPRRRVRVIKCRAEELSDLQFCLVYAAALLGERRLERRSNRKLKRVSRLPLSQFLGHAALKKHVRFRIPIAFPDEEGH